VLVSQALIFNKKKLDKIKSGNCLPFCKPTGKFLPFTLPLNLPAIDRLTSGFIDSNVMCLFDKVELIKECA
jgi:hypothetical protein